MLGAAGELELLWVRWRFEEKGHGRWTEGEVDVCRLGPAMRQYLKKDLGWPGAQVMGRYRVRRRNLVTGQEQVGERLWLAGAAWDIWGRLGVPSPKPWVTFWRQVWQGHWAIENRSFYVLDASWHEDDQRAREVGRVLHILRVWAMNLLRRWGGSHTQGAMHG